MGETKRRNKAGFKVGELYARQTLLDRIWKEHEVFPEQTDQPAILYIDLHLIHEVTSHTAFAELESRNLQVYAPLKTLAQCDHAIPTTRDSENHSLLYANSDTKNQVELLIQNCSDFGIECFTSGDKNHGIVHVVGPELGLAWPGRTIVCGDSHTCTQGAYGALAFGIGSTEVAHVLATQCLLLRKPVSVSVFISKKIPEHSTAKDLALYVLSKLKLEKIAKIASEKSAGTGFVLEFLGPAVRAMSMEERLTLCNMAVEAGARTGLMAADSVTFADLQFRERAPKSAEFAQLKRKWMSVNDDEFCPDSYVCNVTIDASLLTPRLSYGTSPSLSISCKELNSSDIPLLKKPIDVVFLGSCTNGRISDLRLAAKFLKNNKININVTCIVVPGSLAVKKAAEAEGLDKIFVNAGAQWREPGCSFCVAMNGDYLKPGQVAVSTSIRNFAGRQGPGSHTILASPATAIVSAIRGFVCDPREFTSET